MRHIIRIIFSFLALASISVYSQPANDNCVRAGSYNTKDIEKIFPFSKANKIKIVSFKNADTDEVVHKIPKVDDQVDTLKLFEIITLSTKDRDELFDILMNLSYDRSKGEEIIGDIRMCYLPRNAILFEDTYGRVFSYLEICFECLRYKIQPEDIKIGDFCHEKFELLQKFFVNKGILYVSDH